MLAKQTQVSNNCLPSSKKSVQRQSRKGDVKRAILIHGPETVLGNLFKQIIRAEESGALNFPPWTYFMALFASGLGLSF